jgi:hypothetical protein
VDALSRRTGSVRSVPEHRMEGFPVGPPSAAPS